MTFAVPLKVTIRLVVWDKDAETGARTIRAQSASEAAASLSTS